MSQPRSNEYFSIPSSLLTVTLRWCIRPLPTGQACQCGISRELVARFTTVASCGLVGSGGDIHCTIIWVHEATTSHNCITIVGIMVKVPTYTALGLNI